MIIEAVHPYISIFASETRTQTWMKRQEGAYVVAEIQGLTVMILPSYSEMKVYRGLEYAWSRSQARGSTWGCVGVRIVVGSMEGALVTREWVAVVVALLVGVAAAGKDDGSTIASPMAAV
jgi:hypothetical protein